jgi:hypothetical protein
LRIGILPDSFFKTCPKPQDVERIAGMPADGAILPDFGAKNNEGRLRNPVAGIDRRRLTAATGSS